MCLLKPHQQITTQKESVEEMGREASHRTGRPAGQVISQRESAQRTRGQTTQRVPAKHTRRQTSSRTILRRPKEQVTSRMETQRVSAQQTRRRPSQRTILRRTKELLKSRRVTQRVSAMKANHCTTTKYQRLSRLEELWRKIYYLQLARTRLKTNGSS